MKFRKRYLWISAIVVVIAGGVVAYKAYTAPKIVSLASFNTKEGQLTHQASTVYKQIQDKYIELEKGTINPAAFKKALLPLRDEMKKNWQVYDQYRNHNQLTQTDRASATFQKGVSVASTVRLYEYAFLVSVETYTLDKPQIEQKYAQDLAQYKSQMAQYEKATKKL